MSSRIQDIKKSFFSKVYSPFMVIGLEIVKEIKLI